MGWEGRVMQGYAMSLSLNESVEKTPARESALAELIEEVRQFEFAWGVAYINRDTAALERFMADDYTFTDPLGGVTDKRQNLDYISTGLFVIEDTHSRDVGVRIYGETAVVTALSNFKASYKGVKVHGRYQYTDVLVRRQGRWSAVASQATLAQRGLVVLLCGRFLGDRLRPLTSLRHKIRRAFSG